MGREIPKCQINRVEVEGETGAANHRQVVADGPIRQEVAVAVSVTHRAAAASRAPSATTGMRNIRNGGERSTSKAGPRTFQNGCGTKSPE
jgi:hypothetical protein